MEKKPLLRIFDVYKSFGGIKAVDGVSFDLFEKQIKAVVGPNGAGKTTLFNIITGLYKADRGKIELFGEDITNCKSHKLIKKGIARTFQNIQLISDLTVFENIAIGAHHLFDTNLLEAFLGLYKKNEKKVFEKLKWIIRFLKIEEYVDLYPDELPFGIKRIVEIGRAIASNPKLLLLDEPAAGLNESESEQLLNIIFRVWEKGTTILLIDHDIEFVASCSHSIVVMDSGKKIAEGLPSEVLNDERVIRAYIGE